MLLSVLIIVIILAAIGLLSRGVYYNTTPRVVILLFVALAFASDGSGDNNKNRESKIKTIPGRVAAYYGHGDSLKVIAENKQNYNNDVEALRKLITERILLGDDKYACAEWTWGDVIHDGVKVLGLREGTIGPKPEKEGPHAHYVGKCVHAELRLGEVRPKIVEHGGNIWHLVVADILKSDLTDSRAIYAYNPAMAVLLTLPEKRFVCVPCVVGVRAPVELKNSSGEIIKPRVGILFRSEDFPLLMGSRKPVDVASDCDRIVVEVIIWLGPITPGRKPI